MVAHITSVAYQGIDVTPVDVQVQIAAGLPSFSIVGLGDKAVTESRERVRAALGSMGLSLPPKRITINLAPADLQKEGSHLDLPIALALLVQLEVISQEEVANYIAIGELSLDGSITPVSGVLPAAIEASAQGKGLICPEAGGTEASWAGEIAILAAPSLLALVNHFKGTQVLTQPAPPPEVTEAQYPDMKDIKGQQAARRALEITAAGGHNLLMIGPPGSGKSMLAARLPGLIPEMTAQEALRVSMVQSVAGQLLDGTIRKNRPFREPHHNCSMAAMVGGGAKAKPGEVTLAHAGILFLDELPEFPRQVLDALRQPLETGRVTVARAQSHITYPAQFQLIAAMNPCRCGYLDDPAMACSRAPKCATEYQNKLSGPLLDRIDIHIEVPAVTPQDIRSEQVAEDSQTIAKRVYAAREVQLARYQDMPITTNAQADGETLPQFATPDEAGQELLEQAMEKLRLSMRGYNRILRVARTIADLEHAEQVQSHHIAEALSYRQIHFHSRKAA